MRITASSSSSIPSPSSSSLPPLLLSPFGAYPNVLKLTDDDRIQFHPVVAFPVPPTVVDYTGPNQGNSNRQLVPRMATPEEWQTKKRSEAAVRPPEAGAASASASASASAALLPPPDEPSSMLWTLGRYDEDRIGLYESALFENESNEVHGFAGKRTVHVGIDLGGPVGTPVYSFWDGRVHSVGYNPDLGDYGHVIVVHYPQLPSSHQVYALFGHLDATVLRWKVGDPVAKGQLLAGLGNVHENGGWLVPHVHFQLGMTPPQTHDMAGAVSPLDRDRALLEHPDPRYVLGELY